MISFGRNGTSGIQTGPWVPALSFCPTLFLMDKYDWRTTLLISIKKQTHVSWNSLSSVPSPCRSFLRLPWSLGSLLQWHHQAGWSQRLLGPRGPALPGGGCVPQERGAAGGRQELQPSSAEDPEGEGSIQVKPISGRKHSQRETQHRVPALLCTDPCLSLSLGSSCWNLTASVQSHSCDLCTGEISSSSLLGLWPGMRCVLASKVGSVNQIPWCLWLRWFPGTMPFLSPLGEPHCCLQQVFSEPVANSPENRAERSKKMTRSNLPSS